MNQLFERFPTVLAAISFAVLITTVVHEWGYFSVVGIHFQALVSATDYLANSILWLPQTLLIVGGGLVSGYIVGGWLGSSGAEFSVVAPPHKHREADKAVGFLLSWTALVFQSLLVGLLVGIALISALVDPLIGMPLILMFVLPMGTRTYISRWPGTLSGTAIFGIVTGPLMLGAAFAFGVVEGRLDLKGTKDLVRIERKDAAVGNEVQLLRSFDRGILVHKVIDGRVEFIRWDEVRAMSIAREAPKEWWPACLIFQSCPSTVPAPPPSS
jgi:hypothetical protein